MAMRWSRVGGLNEGTQGRRYEGTEHRQVFGIDHRHYGSDPCCPASVDWVSVICGGMGQTLRQRPLALPPHTIPFRPRVGSEVLP